MYITLYYIVQYNTVQCTLQYNTVYNTIQYNTAQYSTVYSTVQYSTVYSTIHYIVHCNTIQYSVQNSTVHCTVQGVLCWSTGVSVARSSGGRRTWGFEKATAPNWEFENASVKPWPGHMVWSPRARSAQRRCALREHRRGRCSLERGGGLGGFEKATALNWELENGSVKP